MLSYNTQQFLIVKIIQSVSFPVTATGDKALKKCESAQLTKIYSHSYTAKTLID